MYDKNCDERYDNILQLAEIKKMTWNSVQNSIFQWKKRERFAKDNQYFLK